LGDSVSKQTVKNLVHDTVIELPIQEQEEKKRILHPHIKADEEHVAAHFFEKKGDLKRDREGRKNNTLMPKLICVYEDIVKENGEKSQSKRYRLIGKHYFSREKRMKSCGKR